MAQKNTSLSPQDPSLLPHSLIARFKGKDLFGIRFVVYIELLAFFIILEIIDFSFFEGKRFWGVNPHPFWLPILVMTMQYGTNVGLVTASIATSILLLGNLPAQAMSQDLYAYIGTIIIQPVLWFISALLLGELRMRHIREKEKLETYALDLEHKTNTITDAYHRLQDVKFSLEHRIATHMRSVIYLYEAAKSIESLEEADIYQNIGNLIKNVLAPQKFSLYMQDPDRPDSISLVIYEGWEEKDMYSKSYSLSSPLYQSVILQQKALCISSAEDQEILDNQGILAGPLYDKELGRVIGMLKIEQISFLELTVTNVENFKILCDWLGMSLSKVHRIEKIQNDSYLNPARNLLSHGFLNYLVKFLSILGKRVGFPMSMIAITPTDNTLTPHQVLSLTSAINTSVEKTLRSIDLAFDCHKKDSSFIIVLPSTPVENAPLVVQKLKKEIAQHLSSDIKDIDLTFAVQKLS